MSWARLDDRAPSHPKIVRLSDAAFRLWATALCYAQEHLTDGLIESDIPEILPRAPQGKELESTIAELVNRKVWDEVEGGWMIHNFLDWNPSRDEVESKREKRQAAGKAGGQSSGRRRSNNEANAQASAQANAKQTEANGEAIASTETKQTGSKNEPHTHTHTQIHPQAPSEGGRVSVRLENMPLDERLALISRDPLKFQFASPHEWPEVVEVAKLFGDGFGFKRAPQLRHPQSDKDTAKILDLLQAFSLDELREAAKEVPRNSWLSDKKRFSALSISVVRGLLNNHSAVSAQEPEFYQSP